MTRAAHLLDAVLDVMADQGIGGVSVRAVAAAAGVSASQVQYYYRAKSDLVRAGFAYAGEQFMADVQAARPATLRALVEQWLPLDRRRERRARVWLAYAAAAAVDPVLGHESAELDRELRAWFAGTGLTEHQAARLLALIDGVATQCLMLPLPERQALVDVTVTPYLTELAEPGSSDDSRSNRRTI